MSEPIHIISLGAGVQSSAMAIMAANGEIGPMPSFAVFSDTGSEPAAVYEWLDRLSNMLPFPVVIAKSHRGTLHDNILSGGFSQIPCFTEGKEGKAVIGKRQCTNHWKLRPINKAIRATTQTARKRLAPETFHVWKGISTDEASRAKPSQEKCQKAVFPLLDNMMSREHCRLRLHKDGLPAVKSACVFCPYRSDHQWQQSKQAGGDEWDLIVSVDRKLNQRGEFLHASLKPIDEVQFNPKEDRNQRGNAFNNECEGMCGV